MSYEVIISLIFLFLCWAVLAVIDVVVAGIAALLGEVRFRTVFLWGLLSFLFPVIAFAYGTLIERNLYQVKEVSLEFSSLPKSFDGLKIVHISDIHLKSFAHRPESLRRAVDRINSLNPDMVCFTGDLITLDVSEMDGLEDILKDIQSPVFSVMGNHDYHIYAGRKDKVNESVIEAKVEELRERERSLGWEVLQNSSRIIYHAGACLAIVGVEYHGDLQAAIQGTEGAFRILLSHDPTQWDMEVVGKDIPLTLSGHTHAMQFSLLGWSPSRYLFKRYRGLYKEGGQYLYVNVGLGETIFPTRIGVRPEITLITLETK